MKITPARYLETREGEKCMAIFTANGKVLFDAGKRGYFVSENINGVSVQSASFFPSQMAAMRYMMPIEDDK